MIVLNEMQVWTTIGVLGATLVGTITLVSTLLLRTLRAEFAAVRSEFGRVHDRLDHLDRDVNALMRRTFGADRD